MKPKAYNAAACKLRLQNAFTCNKEPIAAVQVFKPPLVPLEVTPRVHTADMLVLNADLAVLSAPDAKGRLETKLFPITRLQHSQDKQGRLSYSIWVIGLLAVGRTEDCLFAW